MKQWVSHTSGAIWGLPVKTEKIGLSFVHWVAAPMGLMFFPWVPQPAPSAVCFITCPLLPGFANVMKMLLIFLMIIIVGKYCENIHQTLHAICDQIVGNLNPDVVACM